MKAADYGQDFTAVDVELANSDPASICEIGVARFRAGELVETWRALINPEGEYLRPYHSDLHGISARHTEGAPTFPDVYPTLHRFIGDEVCVFHGAGEFDRSCIIRACERYRLDDVTSRSVWISTLQLARDHWPDASSHKLERLCKQIGHEYFPHNALEDAIACAVVFRAVTGMSRTAAIAASGNPGNRQRTFRRIASRRHETGLQGNEEGPFAGMHIVITGTLGPPWDDRALFERQLSLLGFVPRASISRKTKILVTGEGAGPAKLAKALEQGIQIMHEAEFLALIAAHLDNSEAPFAP